MKTYQVELKRVSYITTTIEATNPDSAEEFAWLELLDGENNDWDAEWTLSDITEVKA